LKTLNGINKKRLSAAIALAFALMIAATLFTSVAFAQQPLGGNYPAFASAFATPSKIGVGDLIYIVGWVTPGPAIEGEPYYNYTFIITKPDGTVENILYPTSNVEASRSFTYGPCNQAGTYTVKLSFPGDLVHGLRPAAISPPYSWIVEQGYVVPTYPSEPLPTEKWSYPISAEYWEWYQISGPWSNGPTGQYNSSGTNFNPYSKGPASPHVLWKLPWTGGILGGDQGNLAGGASAPYPVAAQGKIYYTYSVGKPTDTSATTRHPMLVCRDQYTGQVIFERELFGTGTVSKLFFEFQATIKERSQTDPELLLGPTSAFSLWAVGGGLREINPLNGDTMYYLAGPASGLYSDGKGFDDDAYWILANYPKSGNVSRFNCRTRQIEWTVDKWPTTPEPGSTMPGSTGCFIYEDMLISLERYVPMRVWNTTTGKQILEGPIADFWPIVYRSMAAYGNVYWDTPDRKTVALSIATGKEVWRSDVQQSYPWGEFNAYSKSAAYGNIYINSYDGYMYCYNGANGKLVWKSDFVGNTTETAMGTYALWGNTVIADGKVYVATGEHTSANPRPRGNALWCFDAFTGKLIWKYDGFMGQTNGGGISSGMLWYKNEYDGCLYMFGKGESAITVTAPLNSVPQGTGVLIQGTVTDLSSGQKDTPAISDESMNAWMQHIHNNKPAPLNATGVTVFLQAMRSDGTLIDITHVKSDALGHYVYTWVPTTQDTYKIVATFEGSNSYYASSNECGLSVGPAAAVAPIVTPTPTTPTQTATPIVTPTVAPTPTPTTPAGPGGLPASTLYAIAAAVVVIVIVAVAAVALRRRK
jgi:outer membrane protein assembly factor BamB